MSSSPSSTTLINTNTNHNHNHNHPHYPQNNYISKANNNPPPPPPSPSVTNSSRHHKQSSSAGAAPSSSSSSSASPSPSSQQPTNQACAACKYQRRRCKPECTLAPYFPASQQRQFLNAHRLFGVSNILKIIRNLDPHSRDEAMASIIFQSNVRATDPISGCYGLILDLEKQIQHDTAEYALVMHQLSICRAQAAAAAAATIIPQHQQHNVSAGNHLSQSHDIAMQETNLLLNSPADEVVYGGQQQQQQHYYNYFYFGNENDNNDNNTGSNEANGGFSLNNISDGGDVNGLEIDMLSLQQKGGGGGGEEDEDVKPLVDVFEMRDEFTIGDDQEVKLATTKPVHLDALHCR